MKKVALITIYDMSNNGNRLQNYALQEVLKQLNFKVETIINLNRNFNIRYYLGHIKNIIMQKRYKNFWLFNKNINFAKNKVNLNKIPNKISNYDYYIVGSDQIWNPNFQRLNNLDLLTFTNSQNKISFAASFGINELPISYHEKTRKELSKFKTISLREDRGKQIVERLTNRKDIEVLVDPTMLLPTNEWNRVAQKPNIMPKKEYILTYFLGDITKEYSDEIKRVAKENNYAIINLLDKKSPYYSCGPSEFLYLESHAKLICTDSFHSSVFAIIYDKPFIVFDRSQKNIANMNSRIETLLNKFNLQSRKFTGKITKDLLNHDYAKTYKILEKEKQKAHNFLEKSLDVNK